MFQPGKMPKIKPASLGEDGKAPPRKMSEETLWDSDEEEEVQAHDGAIPSGAQAVDESGVEIRADGTEGGARDGSEAEPQAEKGETATNVDAEAVADVDADAKKSPQGAEQDAAAPMDGAMSRRASVGSEVTDHGEEETEGGEGAASDGAEGPDLNAKSFKADSSMDNALNRGIRIFNLNPVRGIEFIQRHGLVQQIEGDEDGNARRVAIFLRYMRGLNKEQIGKILGSERREHVNILRNYVSLFDFSPMGPNIPGLLEALRQLFACFKPPGEGQKIERILEHFSIKFNEDNKLNDGRPEKADFFGGTTEVLAFSIVLLNVDLHNPNNPRRMTRAQFVSNLRGLDRDGDTPGDLPQEKLEALYDSVQRKQMRHHVDRDEVAGNLFTHPDKSGWLHKKGPTRVSKWRQRWFILSENTLYYFKHSEDVEFQGFIPLENVLVRTCFDPKPTKGQRHSPYASMNGSTSNMTASAPAGFGAPGEAPRASGERAPVGRRLSRRSSLRMPPKLSHARSEYGLRTGSADADSARARRKRNFWFELYPWDDRLNVKSARMSRSGALTLGQHRTIKLQADSRQELELWVELINRKGRFNRMQQHLLSRSEQGDPAMPGSPVSTSTRSSTGSKQGGGGTWRRWSHGPAKGKGTLARRSRGSSLFTRLFSHSTTGSDCGLEKVKEVEAGTSEELTDPDVKDDEEDLPPQGDGHGAQTRPAEAQLEAH